MGNDCQKALSAYGCSNIPSGGAECLTRNDDGTCGCLAFRNVLPGTTTCGTVSGDAATQTAQRVSAYGKMFKHGTVATDLTATVFGSNPGSVKYRQLVGADSMAYTACNNVAETLLTTEPNMTASSRAYCFRQTDPLGFGIETGVYVGVCDAACPVLPTAICGLADCTLVGEAFENLPEEASDALSDYTMDTNANSSTTGTPDTVADTADVLGNLAEVIGLSLLGDKRASSGASSGASRNLPEEASDALSEYTMDTNANSTTEDDVASDVVGVLLAGGKQAAHGAERSPQVRLAHKPTRVTVLRALWCGSLVLLFLTLLVHFCARHGVWPTVLVAICTAGIAVGCVKLLLTPVN